MKTILVSFDEETYAALEECAGRELRTVSTQVLAMVRQAMGLPFPYQESPLNEEPNLITKTRLGGRNKSKPRHTGRTEITSNDAMAPQHAEVETLNNGDRMAKTSSRRRKSLTPAEDITPSEGEMHD